MRSTHLSPVLAGLLALVALSSSTSWALAQPQAPVAAPPTAHTSPIKVAAAPSRPAVASTKSGWAELTAVERTALAPLSSAWNTMSDSQKRKWQALSKNYNSLPASEQAKLHSRMTGWAALSPQQRSQARLNFAETKALAPGDKKAKWEAYQALTAEQKRKLASDAGKKAPSTAAAVKPVPAKMLARTPKPSPEAKSPRIATGPAPAASPISGQSGAPAQAH